MPLSVVIDIISYIFSIPGIIILYGFLQYLTGFLLFLEKVLFFIKPDYYTITKVRNIPFL
jgi:hypothetical protein